MFAGADPAVGWKMTDPIYGKTPTLGACMPNIRKAVEKGDYIFSISGRVKDIQQYIVGGFKVDEKINALSAYERIPENRMRISPDGKLEGNIIIDEKGNHLEIDYHSNHEKRIENYIIGKDAIVINDESEVKKAREETLSFLNNLFSKNEDSISKIVARWRKLNEGQIDELLTWMGDIKKR